MTLKELKHLPLRKLSHLNGGDWSATVYESTDITPKVAICVHSKRNELGEWMTNEVHYMVNGLVYNSRRAFLAASKKIEFKSINPHTTYQ